MFLACTEVSKCGKKKCLKGFDNNILGVSTRAGLFVISLLPNPGSKGCHYHP